MVTMDNSTNKLNLLEQAECPGELYRELLNASPDAILIVDQQGRILRVNHATQTLFGYPSNELAGESIEVLVPAQLRDKHQELRRGYAQDPQPRFMGSDLELLGVRKDGSEFYADISIGPVQSTQGRITICTVRDISLRKHRERELQEQACQLLEYHHKLEVLATKLCLAEENERRRIAIGLHDDVGQTLAAARIILDKLLEGNLPEDKKASAREAYSLVDRAIKSTRSLTFELASAALYEIGLEAALQSACEHVEQQSGIRFQPPESFRGPPIPERMRVILYRAGRELMRNIVKHSKAGTAAISLVHRDNQLRMTVVDDGCGFETSKTLSVKDTQAGIGLLSITQQLGSVDGSLDMQSSPGSGTKVVIIVPLDTREHRE
jgi:PAS domain S-box-containing protein